MNAETYCQDLTDLRSVIKRKRPGLLTRKVFLIHDNARPHAARLTQELLQKFRWKVFNHPHPLIPLTRHQVIFTFSPI